MKTRIKFVLPFNPEETEIATFAVWVDVRMGWELETTILTNTIRGVDDNGKVMLHAIGKADLVESMEMEISEIAIEKMKNDLTVDINSL